MVDCCGHVRRIKLDRNMLRAIHIPRGDSEQDRLLRLGAVVFGHQLRDYGRIVRNMGTAPQLDPPAMRIIHQEQEGLRIFGQIAGRDKLAVPGIVRKAEGVLVQHADEALGAAAMLGIGLPGGIGGGQIGGIHLPEKIGEIFIDHGAKPAALFHPGISLARSALGLNALDSGREGNVAGRCRCHRLYALRLALTPALRRPPWPG